MSSQDPPTPSDSGYECVNCSSPVDSLYTSYFQQSNTSLLECPKCGHLADDFLSFPFSISLLNLVLLKPEVYRHLLRNRGGEKISQRRKYQAIETLRLAAISISVDSLVRCVASTSNDDLETLELFFKTFGYCTLETISLVLSIIIASFCLRRNGRSNLSDLALLPLAVLYSSLPTTFFLVISSVIWREEYLPSPSLIIAPSSSTSALLDLSPYLEKLELLSSTRRDYPHKTFESSWASYIVSFSRANLKSGLAQVGSARGWASEALLRKGIGGSSAVVAVSGLTSFGGSANTNLVVLRISKRRAVAVLGLAWAVHLVLLHVIDGLIT
ncbi:hypothetical protein JCM16303_000957 [Sporobolomyces ruberrimus]